MNPLQQTLNNKAFLESSNSFVRDSNPYLNNQFTTGLQKPQEYQQFLLDDMSGNSQKQIGNAFLKNQIPTNNSFNNGNFTMNNNGQQDNYTSSFNQNLAVKNQKMKGIVSNFDDDIEELMRLASNQSVLQQKKQIRKQAIQKEQKNKKTMSRLSQQFFPRPSCQAIESGIKSKLKSRQTIGSFGLEKGKNKLDPYLINEQNKGRTGQFDLMPNSEKFNTQNMEIEGQSYNENSQQNFTKSSQQQKNFNQLNIQPTSVNLFTQPVSLTKSGVQRRLSEVKRQRDRLSMGRDNLVNFIRSMDEEEKKKEIKIEKHKQRVTVDFFNILKIISESDETQKPQSKTLSQQIESPVFPQASILNQQKPSRKLNQLINTLQPQKIIIQDERQDDFTPMKNYEQQKNKFIEQFANSYDSSLFFGKQNIKLSKKKPQSEKNKIIDYEKYVFDEYLGKIKDKLANQRKIVEDLRKQRLQTVADNAKSLTQFNMTSKSLKQMQNQQQQLSNQISHLKQKLNPNDYLEYKRIIDQFQLNFGIRLHRYDRINKSPNSEGFYVQFTLDNLICRIKRNSVDEPFAIKFQTCLGLKNQDLYLTSFGYQWRTLIYNSFINKKLLKTTHFLSFMVNFAAYIQQLNQLELTYDFISNLHDLRNPQINEVNMSLEFQLVISNKYEFSCKVDLLKLRENEGIQITNIGQNLKIQISQEVLSWKKGTNKLLKSINFIIEHCHELMNRQTEKQIEMISSASK